MMETNTQNNNRGVLLMIVTMIIFAAQDGVSKLLTENNSPIFITMWRYWFFGGVCAIILWRKGWRAGLRSGQPKLQMFRGVLLALEICVAIAAFQIFGLAGSHSIFAFGPLLVVALSGPVLGEQVGWRRWTAILIGFCGMLLILRPGMRDVSEGMLIAILAMVMFAGYGLATRQVARTDVAMTSFLYTGVFGAIVMTFIGPWYWSAMDLRDSLLMMSLCCSGMIGHFLLIKAFEAAEASTIQPFAYLQTVFVILIGVVLFGEVVSPWTYLGAAIVISAGLFAFWREHVRARAAGKQVIG